MSAACRNAHERSERLEQRSPGPMVSRRTALKLGGVLSLGVAVTACSADESPRLDGVARVLVDGVIEAQPWHAFLDSVGVAAHWSFLDTPYARTAEVADLIADCGIRHVRSEASADAARLLAERGLSSTFLVDVDVRRPRDVANQLEVIRPLVDEGGVVAVEGPNEPDLFWVEGDLSYQGLPFPNGVLAWQEELFGTVRSDPQLRDLTVIGPSFGQTYWGGGHPFEPGSLADVVDVGNFHPYPSGNPYAPQQTYAGIAEYYRHSDFPSVALDRHPINLDTYRPPFGDKPMMVTETGYSTWRLGQSEAVQARYLPRLYLENYRLGIVRTYMYEFVDEFPDPTGQDREWHFGMLRHDLSAKPSYHAVRDLLRAVRGDDGAVAVRIPVKLTAVPAAGYDATALHHVALARSAGKAAVLLWHEVSANDLSPLERTPPEPLRTVDQPPVGVRLELPAGARLERALVLQDDGTTAKVEVQRRSTELAFEVPDRVVVLLVEGLG